MRPSHLNEDDEVDAGLSSAWSERCGGSQSLLSVTGCVSGLDDLAEA